MIAHRGSTSRAPENTIEAFRDAIAGGADGIELDVQMTGDGVPVVNHDPVLAPGPGSSPMPISGMTLRQVRELRPVPTLAEVLDTVAGRCRLFVELKAAASLEPVVALVRGHADWCALHSFDHRVVARAAAMARGIPRGVLLVSRLIDPLAVLQAADADTLWQHHDMVDTNLVEMVHAAGCRIIAWTVNDEGRARHLASIGVDGVCTDRLATVRNAISR